MKYNSGGFTPPEKKAKRITIIFIGVFIAIIVGVAITLICLTTLNIISVKIEVVISIIAVLISLSTILFTFLDRLYAKYFSTKKTIDLSVEVIDNSIICWGEIGNLGHKRILNKNVYLIVSKGELKNGVYEFGLSLEHEDDNGKISHLEDFCIYSKIMHFCDIDKCSHCINNLDSIVSCDAFDERKKRVINRYNDQVLNNQTYHRIFVFKGLSKESRLFVDAGEEFSDEIVLNLEKGIYRAVMVWIPEGAEDCACSVKYFKVNN